MSLAEGALRDFIEAHACASTGRSLKHLPLIGEESSGVDLAGLEIGFFLWLYVFWAVSYVLTCRQSVTHDPAKDWLGIELSGAEFYLCLCGRKRRRSIVDLDHSLLHTHYITMQGC